MIKEDYITFGIAKFIDSNFDCDCECHQYYDDDGNITSIDSGIPCYSVAVIMKWLREVKHVDFEVHNVNGSYLCDVMDLIWNSPSRVTLNGPKDSYESICNESIEWVLKNMELIKNRRLNQVKEWKWEPRFPID